MPRIDRTVLAIPLDEVRLHLERNTRQDIKIVVPEILTAKLSETLLAKGKDVKDEEAAEDKWRHSERDRPNLVCLASDFAACLEAHSQHGPFALSFANAEAEQEEHFHKQHLEIYFSEHAIAAEFAGLDGAHPGAVNLKSGGAIIFAAGIVHKVRLSGLTLILEIPAVSNDKFSASATKSA